MDDMEGFAEVVALTIKGALAPIQERVAAAEARLGVLGDLRDRVVTIEAKAVTNSTPAVVEELDPADIQRLTSEMFRKALRLESAA